jgi:hypothetical protein
MKWLFKWALRIVVLVVVAIVLLLVYKDTILRMVAEHQIRTATGMDVKIGHISSGLLSPVVNIENITLYNTSEFGGTEFLVVPELHIEYDAGALANEKFRIKLLRADIAELDIVRNFSGQTNIFTMFSKMPKDKTGSHGIHIGRKNFKFESIDVLNLSLRRARFIDLKNHTHDGESLVNLDNQVFPNVKTGADFKVIVAVLCMRSGSFLDPRDFIGGLFKSKPAQPPDPIERPKPAPAHN